MKIYLSSPFFNDKENAAVSFAEETLRSRGLTVFSPREYTVPEESGSRMWSEKLFAKNTEEIQACDAVVMLYHGNYSDSGTAWECGYAFALNKPVIVVQLGENSNLMIHEGSHSNIALEDLKTYDFKKLPEYVYSGAMY